ncbi:hypothetical protein STEG23_007936, partial [Scotinomys teguina]
MRPGKRFQRTALESIINGFAQIERPVPQHGTVESCGIPSGEEAFGSLEVYRAQWDLSREPFAAPFFENQETMQLIFPSAIMHRFNKHPKANPYLDVFQYDFHKSLRISVWTARHPMLETTDLFKLTGV